MSRVKKLVLPPSPFNGVLTHLRQPLIWARLECDVRIEDLQTKRFDEALSLLQDHFFLEETLCRASELATEPESVQSYLEVARKWMQDGASLCAMDQESGAMVGVLVARVASRLEHSLTQEKLQLLLLQGEAFLKVMSLRCHMAAAGNIFENFDTDSFFHIHAICVKPKFRGRGIGMGLLLSGARLATALRQPALAGVFTSDRGQTLARKLGMGVAHEVSYADWTDEEGEIVFDNPGRGNYSSMAMAMRVPRLFSESTMYSLGQGLDF
ncbi:arylalkylamine N-acetyltransferase-like 2 [Bacillus rossius redtenbacheri]|uniref:arylalkylamine N-acetyltransferase-like 2 n=1 Tax=Bacillus rossius redtenbacheri TaxID=93214 RepID=UPI002FDDA558